MAKVPFVYEWLITEYEARGFRLSPFFQVSPGGWSPTTWYLKINSCEPDRVILSLCKDSKSRISDIKCTFSVLDSTGKTILAKATEFNLSDFDASLSKIKTWYKKYEIKECLFDDSLSIRVKGTISFDPADSAAAENFNTSAVPHLKSLFEDKVFADVTILCGDESFDAHKAILASQSPVLRKMFEVEMKEKHSNVIEIVDLDPSVVSDLLSFLYTGTVPNMKENAEELLKAADMYEMPHLFSACEAMLQSSLNDANVVQSLIRADMHNAAHLKTACLSYIRGNSTTVYKSSQWKHLQENYDKHSALLMEMLDFWMQ